MILFYLMTACGGNAPTGEPTAPPEVAIIESQKEAPKPETAGQHDGHGDHDHAAAVDPGAIPEGANVSFVEPQAGATVTSPVKVVMNVTGMTVQPAGDIVEGTGHHHIVIDADPVPKGTAVASDEKHLHFGKGQTETELTLTPGTHTLQLQFANGAHISYGEQLSTSIQITVTE